MIILCTRQVHNVKYKGIRTVQVESTQLEGKGFHRMNNRLSQRFHNPAELEDDLRILKSLRKGETTYLEVWLF